MKLVILLTFIILGQNESKARGFNSKPHNPIGYADFLNIYHRLTREKLPQNSDVFVRTGLGMYPEQNFEDFTENYKTSSTTVKRILININKVDYGDYAYEGSEEDKKGVGKTIRYTEDAERFNLIGYLTYNPARDYAEYMDQKALKEAGGIYFDDADGRLLLDLGLHQEVPQ